MGAELDDGGGGLVGELDGGGGLVGELDGGGGTVITGDVVGVGNRVVLEVEGGFCCTAPSDLPPQPFRGLRRSWT